MLNSIQIADAARKSQRAAWVGRGSWTVNETRLMPYMKRTKSIPSTALEVRKPDTLIDLAIQGSE